MPHLKWIDWAVLVAYFVAISSIGLRAARKIHGIDDYYAQNRLESAEEFCRAAKAGRHAFQMRAAFTSSTCSRLALGSLSRQWLTIRALLPKLCCMVSILLWVSEDLMAANVD